MGHFRNFNVAKQKWLALSNMYMLAKSKRVNNTMRTCKLVLNSKLKLCICEHVHIGEGQSIPQTTNPTLCEFLSYINPQVVSTRVMRESKVLYLSQHTMPFTHPTSPPQPKYTETKSGYCTENCLGTKMLYLVTMILKSLVGRETR